MKNLFNLMVTALLMLALSGCTTIKGDTTSMKIYCTNGEGTKLIEENFKPSSKEQDVTIKEMLVKLKAMPEGMDHKSVIPENVEITGYAVNEQQLTVTFDETYRKMDQVTEVLMRAGTVKSLVQIEGIEGVAFQIGSEQLLDDAGQPVGIMSAESFIDTKGQGINSYQYASLTLYFASSNGMRLVKEMRNVHYSTNMTLERVVLDQLIAGPVNPNLKPILPPGTKVTGITQSDGVGIVNFDEAFANTALEQEVLPEVTIYGIVNSLVDVCGISKVQLQIAGQGDIKYRDKISLNTPFERNQELIHQVESVSNTERAVDTSDSTEVTDESNTTEASSDANAVSDKARSKDTNISEKETNGHEPTIGIDPQLQNGTEVSS